MNNILALYGVNLSLSDYARCFSVFLIDISGPQNHRSAAEQSEKLRFLAEIPISIWST